MAGCCWGPHPGTAERFRLPATAQIVTGSSGSCWIVGISIQIWRRRVCPYLPAVRGREETTVDRKETAARENLQDTMDWFYWDWCFHFTIGLSETWPEWAPLCCQTATPAHFSHQPVWWGTHRAARKPAGEHRLAASPGGSPGLPAASWTPGGRLPEAVSSPSSPDLTHRRRNDLRGITAEVISWPEICCLSAVGQNLDMSHFTFCF